MNTPKESVSVLVERIMLSDNPREQVEIAGELLSRFPDSGRDLQMLNRAINYFKEEHPEAYDRAKSSTFRLCRSIPPMPSGGQITYLRIEEACARLVEAKKRWATFLKEKKAGFYETGKTISRDQVSRGIRDMDTIGRRKNKPSHAKPAESRKPKRRLHS